MKIAISAILAAFLFAGCGGSSNFTLNQNYENVDFSGKVLLIAPIANDAVKVLNKDDVADDFPQDKREPEVILSNMVYKSATEYADRYLMSVKIYKEALDSSIFLSQYDKSKYFRLSEPLDNHELLPYYYVPKKEVLNSSNIKPDMILVINRLKFGRGAHTFVNAANPGGGSSSPALIAEYDYILYDYNKNEVVAVGGSKADSPFLFAMTRSNWDGIIKQITPEFFMEMPFHVSSK